MVAEVADIIGQKYKRLSIPAKTKFHAEQVKVEIIHFKILTSHSCHCINEIELELEYIQDFEET